MKKSIIAAGIALATVISLSGCIAADPEKSDAPDVPRQNIVVGTNTHVIMLPDGFRNIAFTCFGTKGVYVTSRGWNQNGTHDYPSLPSAVFVLPNDPDCAGR